MSSAQQLPSMTVEEFLAWEERQELRYEFDGFGPVAMAGGTEVHELIQVNLVTALTNRLRGSACRAYGANLKIRVAGRIRYPDAFVACSPPNLRATVRPDPVVVFEVLSRGTARTDRVLKPREYLATPSILRFVLIEQDAASVTPFARVDGRWAGSPLSAGDAIALPEIGIELPVDELYLDLDLGGPEDED